MGFNNITEKDFIQSYNEFIFLIPEKYRLSINLLLFISLITLYSILIFKFYKLIAKRDIIKLNLDKYNNSSHPFLIKFFSFIIYVIGYIIIIPIIVFIWFCALSFFLLILSKNQTINQILIISVSLIGAIRATSYFNESLSEDLSKFFPLTALSVFLLSSNFKEFFYFFEKIKESFSLLNTIIYYLIFIISFETFLRIITFPFREKKEK
ncbi:MAG: hypothetical protein QW117_03340 [Candidatus Pacearchaeota archaeon]